MNNVQSLCHSVWDCKYHIVWIPKYRRKVLFGQLRKHLGEVIRELARQKESQVLEGHLCPDHVPVYLAIPPKYAVAQVVGYKNTSGWGIERRPKTTAQNGNQTKTHINQGCSFPDELRTWSFDAREPGGKQRKNGWRMGRIDNDKQKRYFV